jgi:intracellular septation protein A
MAKPQEMKLGIWRDMAFAALVTGLIIGSWTLVFYYFGEKSAVSNSLVTFAGGVLAVSGLLFRQYMLKEVLEYHNAWAKISEVLTKIEEGIRQEGRENQAAAMKLVAQNVSAKRYCKYLEAELVLIPIVPMAVIFVYGCAILASRSLQFRLGCLSLMLYLVVYLSAAAVSSSKLACSASEPNKIIQELEEIHAMLSHND